VRLSPSRLTALFAPNLFGSGRTLLQSISQAIRLTARSAIATKESYDHCGDGVHRDLLKWVNHSLNLGNLLIKAESNQHKPSGRYADENAVPQ